MAKGFQVGDTCYADYSNALNAYASKLSGQVIANGDLVIVKVSGGMVLDIRHYSSTTGAAISQTFLSTVPLVPDCGLISLDDSLSMSWMVVAAWAVAFSIVMIKRGLS